MPSYSYTALSKSGKWIHESIEASSLDAAKNSIRAAGYTLYDIKEQGVMNKDINLPFLGNPSSKDMAIFCRQFVSILRAGVSIRTVLEMLEEQTENKKLRAAIKEMEADVEQGETLAGAMKKHPKIFDSMLVNMVQAGEESGNLENSFMQMETYYEKAKKTKASVIQVMIYPIILVVVIIVVLIVMMTQIIPMFMETFEELDVELPIVTQIVMAFCNWFNAWWWLLAIIIAAVVIGSVLFYKTDKGKHFFGFLSRKLPVIGSLTVRNASDTFARTLSLLLASGLSLSESLVLVEGNMKNIYFREAVHNIREMVTMGVPLSSAIERTKVFPAMVVNLTAVGEETGDLEGMLSKVADYYDEEVQEATDRLLSMLEPIVILIMAFFVAIIVFAIFLPMLSMTSAYDQYL